jgi:hypothetical protein
MISEWAHTSAVGALRSLHIRTRVRHFVGRTDGAMMQGETANDAFLPDFS